MQVKYALAQLTSWVNQSENLKYIDSCGIRFVSNSMGEH